MRAEIPASRIESIGRNTGAAASGLAAQRVQGTASMSEGDGIDRKAMRTRFEDIRADQLQLALN